MATQRLTVGIVGASGYTGEELVRILARHPRVRLAEVCSRSLAGKSVADEMPRLRGVVDPALAFTASSPEACAASPVEAWVLARPHGVAAEYARGAALARLSRGAGISSPFFLPFVPAGERPLGLPPTLERP